MTSNSSNSFDEKAATWDDDPAKVERSGAIARAIRDVVPLDGSERLLEYGAGTGLVTQSLRSAVGPVTLADTSAGMRAVMEAKVAAGDLADARIWDVDLSAGPVPDERFDLVVTVMALHHIDDIAPVLAAFHTLLEPGGHLCVVDLDAEDGSFHTGEFHGHPGFERHVMASRLADAGFTDVAVHDAGHVDRNGVDYPLFLACCRRPQAPTA